MKIPQIGLCQSFLAYSHFQQCFIYQSSRTSQFFWDWAWWSCFYCHRNGCMRRRVWENRLGFMSNLWHIESQGQTNAKMWFYTHDSCFDTIRNRQSHFNQNVYCLSYKWRQLDYRLRVRLGTCPGTGTVGRFSRQHGKSARKTRNFDF